MTTSSPTRYKLIIEYDGTGLHGWQKVDAGPNVQAFVEAAVLAMTGEAAQVMCCGRTDAGVHALGQVAHVDLARDWSPDRLRDGLNAQLRQLPTHAVTILDVSIAPQGFHARFSCVRRHYLYRILARRPPPAIENGKVYWVASPLDVDVMNEAAATLLGTHDFSTFRDGDCQAKSPIRTLDTLSVQVQGEEFHVFTSAQSFLHRQVRRMVGSLIRVGRGSWTLEDFAQAFAARDRSKCGPVAPAEGLYFARADYPKNCDWRGPRPEADDDLS